MRKQGQKGLRIAIGEAGKKGCSELCVQAAAYANAALGGPLDPVADAVAAAIGTVCSKLCGLAIDRGMEPGSQAFEEYICEGIGF